MYVDSIKIGNTNARAIRTVVDLEAVPTQVFENSPMLIKVGETLYVKNKVAGNIIGTWHLKDTISYATNVGVNFDFVSNDTTYTALLWQNSELHYASQATGEVVVYNSSGWVNQAYRTIVIKSGENADLLAFLQASAEKLIDGYYYYTAVSGSVVIEKNTEDQENFADIVFTIDEFDKMKNNENVIVKINIYDAQSFYFVKSMQANISNLQDMVWFDFRFQNILFELAVIKPHDSTQVAHIVSKQTLPEPPTAINLNDSFPSTAKNGTLTSTQLRTLQSSDQNYIIFNNELFRLNDKQSSEGYLVYSHNGHDTTGCFFQKCITITISTLGWVLEEQENQAKLTAGSGITIENNVISSTGGGTGGGGLNVLEITHEIDSSLIDEDVFKMFVLMNTFSKLGTFNALGDDLEVSTPILVQFYNLGANYFSLTDEQLNNINTGVYDAINVKIQVNDGGTSGLLFDLKFNKQITTLNTDNDGVVVSCYSFSISGYHTDKRMLVLSGGFCKNGIYLSLSPILYKPVSVQVNDDDTIDLTIN